MIINLTLVLADEFQIPVLRQAFSVVCHAVSDQINIANENEWQFGENVVLEKENKDDIILDVLRDGQIGCIEFIDLIYK